MAFPMKIEEAKRLLPLPELMKLLGYGEYAVKSCRSPFRKESTSSFGIYLGNDGFWHFKDAGIDKRGDEIDFLAWHRGVENEKACRGFIELAGGANFQSLPVRKQIAAPPAGRPLPNFPKMRGGAMDELKRLAALRNLSLAGVHNAQCAGVLRFMEWRDETAYVITDEIHSAQMRRLDGKLWEHSNAKAQFLKGSWANWPVGLDQGEFDKILLCEGAPDIIAGNHFIERFSKEVEWCAVTVLGASNKIHEDALPFFTGKRIRIAAHADKPGIEGAKTWRKQLLEVGCKVDVLNFEGLVKADGSPVKDLNDCAYINQKQEHELDDLLP